jgi:malonate-semialdehyde dehydrogenase (acetylating)/methylmalonate-semialdehyde dehydrogenase
MKRLVENCEVACGMPVLQQGDTLVNASPGIDGQVLRLPVGVFTMVAPFNFPGMVPFWFFPYAIAAGNTYVLKPSEQTPMTMQWITELLHHVQLPPGVFNLVHGDRTVVEAFIEHPRVKGLSLVGATRTARAVAEKCARAGKRCQAMGGGEEPSGGDAGCADRRGGAEHDFVVLRMRGATVHGVVGAGGGGAGDV